MTRRSNPAPVSPDLLALLAGCKANPEDDQARLVLADWLEEHGQDERAEFILAQVPSQEGMQSTEQDDERRARAEELPTHHAGAWLGPLLVRRAWFERGLLSVDIPSSLFGSKAEQELAEWDGWPWVEKITISLTAEKVDAAAISPLLHGVSELALNIDQEGPGPLTTRFVASARLDTVRSLNLHDKRIGDAGAAALARNSSLANLSALDLYKNDLQDEGIAALAASPTLRNLRQLNLRNNWLTVTGATALAGSPYLTRLVELDLGDTIALDDKALVALAHSSNLAGLRRLVLSGNKIGNKGIAALAESPHVAGLRSLVLHDNRIGGPGAAALAGSPHLSGLGSLELGNNPIGDRGVAALIASPYLTGLWNFDLMECGIGARGLRGLPSSSAWRNVENLMLDQNRLGDAGVQFVADALLSALRRLGLCQNQVGDRGAEALARSPHLTGLVQLDLWQNDIGTAGARALLALSRLPGLTSLSLTDNRLGRKVKAGLREAFGERLYLDP
jgi:uncharacterized protein (TIGR02996 family)